MIAIPAVDLREGACVQLVGGAYDAERIRLDDPVRVAADWVAMGFVLLHVVDLDAATGRGSNAPVLRELIASVPVPVQVGGGVRDEAAVERLLDAGAARVVVGTRALEDPQWLERLTNRFAGRIVVAADVRTRDVLTRGWSRLLGERVEQVLPRLAALPLAGVLLTAVHNEGRLAGADLALTRDAAAMLPHPLLASGGIASLDDLRGLEDAGAAGAVMGMALYTGAIDARQAAREFGANERIT